jgi:hypothetical protein
MARGTGPVCVAITGVRRRPRMLRAAGPPGEALGATGHGCPDLRGPEPLMPSMERAARPAGSCTGPCQSAVKAALPRRTPHLPDAQQPAATGHIVGPQRRTARHAGGPAARITSGWRRFPSSPGFPGSCRGRPGACCGSRCSSCAPTHRSPEARSGRSRAGSRRSRSW